MKIIDTIRNAGLSVVSFVVFLLLLEVILRIGLTIMSDKVTKVDPWLGWFHEPNSSRVNELEGHTYQLSYNSHGFRLPEHEYEKQKDISRIVILGDSFVDGSEVGDQETFTWLMQERGKDIEVINLGVYGFGTAQQLITLERFGLNYEPDLVILVTMTNDYTDNLLNISSFGPRPRYVLENDSLIFQGTDHPAAQALFRAINLPVPGFTFFHRYSYLYYSINHYIYQRLIANKIQNFIDEQKSVLNEEGQKELYLRLVQRMKAVCGKAGAEFLTVFVYPRKYLLENETSPNAAIAKKLVESNILCLDLFDNLREAELSAEKSLYYVENFHWNPSGQAYIADLLGEWVKTRKNDKGFSGDMHSY